MDFLTKLLNKQIHFSPAIITPEEASSNQKDFDVLLALGVIEKISDPRHIWCKSCQNEGVEVHFVSEGRAYSICTQREDAGRDYFNPAEIKQWQLNTPTLLSLLQKALGIAEPKVDEPINGLLWDFGYQKVNGAEYHLFFCRDINDIEKPKLSLITDLPHSVVFYTGTPHINLPPKVLRVPMMSLIQKITKNGLTLNKEMLEQSFPKNAYSTNGDTIDLDDNFVLKGNRFLFEPHRAGIFKKQSATLRPLALRIIRHLYDIRTHNQENSKTAVELASSLGSTKVSILNEIKRIKKACTDNNLQAVLHEYAGDKYGINPNLRCCQ